MFLDKQMLCPIINSKLHRLTLVDHVHRKWMWGCFAEYQSVIIRSKTAPYRGHSVTPTRWPPGDSCCQKRGAVVGGAGTGSALPWQHLQCTGAIVYLPLRGLANGGILIGTSLTLRPGGQIDSSSSPKREREKVSWGRLDAAGKKQVTKQAAVV